MNEKNRKHPSAFILRKKDRFSPFEIYLTQNIIPDFGSHENQEMLVGTKCTASKNSAECAKAFDTAPNSMWSFGNLANNKNHWIKFEVPGHESRMISGLRIGQLRSPCE